MRIRGGHIIVGGIVAVSLFVGFAIMRTSAVDGRIDVGDPGFYDSVAERSTSSAGQEAGLVPGVDDDPDRSPPKIEISSDKIDLGELSNKTKSVKEFMITNTGDRPLEIKKIDTTCACTMGYMNKSFEVGSGQRGTIPPGQTRPMYIQIDPFKINGWDATKTLTIWSNDPAQPNVMIEVTSHIEPEFELSETKYEFGRVERGAPHKATIFLRQITDEPFNVNGARATGNAVMPALPGLTAASGGEMIPTFDLRVIKRAQEQWASPDKGEWIIEITLSPSLPEGAFNGYYEIDTTAKRLERLHCSFSVEVESFFRVVPHVISRRGGLPQGETEVGSATVMSEVPFTVEDIEVEGPWFSAAAVPTSDSNTVKINVTADANAPTGPKQAIVKMKVKSEDGRSYQHKLGVVVNIRPTTQ